MSQQENNNMDKHFYRASSADFRKIPGSPVAYWASQGMLNAFESGEALEQLAPARKGMVTARNAIYVRDWQEVSVQKSGLDKFRSRNEAKNSGKKWFSYLKGGGFRRWYGNKFDVINWEDDGHLLQTVKHPTEDRVWATNFNLDYIFSPNLNWGAVTSSSFSSRISFGGELFDAGGSACFPKNLEESYGILSFLNSKVTGVLLSSLNPTLNFQAGNISSLPIVSMVKKNAVIAACKAAIDISKKDWDSFELSWDFKSPPLMKIEYQHSELRITYSKLRTYWSGITLEMLRLEEENNSIFIDAYGLQDELTPGVPLSDITLTCNPHYRYGGNLTDLEREERLQSDTLAELISYIIGCMMGRYSLDSEGLVYANAGNEGFKTLVEEGTYTRFPADSDGILPLTSEAWFKDDITARVEEFVCAVWSAEYLEENLQFIAGSLCLDAIKPVKKGGETSRETIRRYLSNQFFKDHLKTYKKRPIYWLFSSGKEKAFECLVYLHRYNETTLPRMRTEYVTPLLGQMDSRIERLRLQHNEAETAEAKRIGKEIDSLTKQLTELRGFDDQLKHYADMKIPLNLDDGVKLNYGNFGTLLAEVKAITGDEAE